MVQRIGHGRLRQLESVFIPLYEMTIVLWNTMVFLLMLIEVELKLFLLLEELLVIVEAFLLFLVVGVFIIFKLFIVVRKGLLVVLEFPGEKLTEAAIVFQALQNLLFEKHVGLHSVFALAVWLARC